DVTVRVHDRDVAASEPAIRRGVPRGFVVAIITEHHVVPTERDFAERAAISGNVIPICVYDAKRVRDRVAHALTRFELRLLVCGERSPFRTPFADDRRPEGFGEPVQM